MFTVLFTTDGSSLYLDLIAYTSVLFTTDGSSLYLDLIAYTSSSVLIFSS
jgi:hypothetical protein